MAAHLIEISAAVDPGAHALPIADQAGWQLTPKLTVPEIITVMALPPRSLDVGHRWRMSGNSRCDDWLGNWIFKSYEDIVEHVLPTPGTTSSANHGRSCPSAMRKWAHRF